jgi:hypothetical protein
MGNSRARTTFHKSAAVQRGVTQERSEGRRLGEQRTIVVGQLVDGVWHDGWYDTSRTGGRFVRANGVFPPAFSRASRVQRSSFPVSGIRSERPQAPLILPSEEIAVSASSRALSDRVLGDYVRNRAAAGDEDIGPSSTKVLAVARPVPLLPPVMTATFPSNLAIAHPSEFICLRVRRARPA